KDQSCQSKNKSCLISSALDKKYSELLTYEQFQLRDFHPLNTLIDTQKAINRWLYFAVSLWNLPDSLLNLGKML
ncbi:hypothetical protein, partial [Leuconostoc citreum]